MTYNFDEQLAKGKGHEDVQDEFYASLGWLVSKVEMERERQSIDRTFKHSQFPWVTFTVEYKADEKANETGNMFIEVASTETTAGTHWKCAAKLMSVLIPQRQEFRLLSVVLLKRYIPVWLMRYPVKEIPNQQDGSTWTTYGLPVPLDIIDATVLMAGPFWANKP